MSKRGISKTKNYRSGPFEAQLSVVKRSRSWGMNGAITSTLSVSRFRGSLDVDIFMIAESEKTANISWVLMISSVSCRHCKA